MAGGEEEGWVLVVLVGVLVGVLLLVVNDYTWNLTIVFNPQYIPLRGKDQSCKLQEEIR